MLNLKRRIEKRLVAYLTKNLLVAITIDDILQLTNKGWYLRGRKLSEEEVIQLREETRSFKDSLLWNLMANEIRYRANLLMFEKSADEGNSTFGRAMLHNLDLLEKFMDNCG